MYSSFSQLDTNCEFFPKEHIGIMRFLKSTLQFLQLKIGKCSAVSTLLPFSDDAGRSLFVFRAGREIICCKKINVYSSRATLIFPDEIILRNRNGFHSEILKVVDAVNISQGDMRISSRNDSLVGSDFTTFRGHVEAANAS